MSSTHPEDSSNAENNLTPAELDELKQLEAVAQHGLGAYLRVGTALAEIRDRHLYRDSHPSFETYVSERWGVNIASADPVAQTTIDDDARATPTAELEPRGAVRSAPCEALAEACEETLSALTASEREGVEIRLAVRRSGDPDRSADRHSLDPLEVAEPAGDDLLPMLRWRLSQASGTIGEVAYQLERRATDIDDTARAQLRDDVYVLDDELATVKALLFELIDWDAELTRLLEDEPPPLDTDTDPDDD